MILGSNILEKNMPNTCTKFSANIIKNPPIGQANVTLVFIYVGIMSRTKFICSCQVMFRRHLPFFTTLPSVARINHFPTHQSNMAPHTNMPKHYPSCPHSTRKVKSSFNKYAASFYFMVVSSIAQSSCHSVPLPCNLPPLLK